MNIGSTLKGELVLGKTPGRRGHSPDSIDLIYTIPALTAVPDRVLNRKRQKDSLKETMAKAEREAQTTIIKVVMVANVTHAIFLLYHNSMAWAISSPACKTVKHTCLNATFN